MQFNSLEYAIFLVVVFLGFWLLARWRSLRVLLLLVASYVFYAASNPWFITLLAASSVTDYFAGLGIAKARETGHTGRRKLFLLISLTMNLGLLGVFKYSNFFYESVVDVASIFGAGWTFERLPILLPAGISFYTFQTMSYSIDVYRGRMPAERSFLRFAFFVGYFPQLVAGPIVRAIDFIPQIGKQPFFSRLQAARAGWLIGLGLFKKVVIADYLAVNLVDRIFDAPERFSSLEVLVGLYGYTMQVYMDFSAYTDIAIGSALLFGFRLPDNFDRPYKATSIQDFWRRWHMTLGSWLRDYLYYPLGGSKGGSLRTYFNLFVTFVLIGLWHGASWTFVIYGCLHATAMCLNRFWRVNVLKRQKPVLTTWGWVWRVFVTLNFVAFARILFRAQDFTHAGEVVAAMTAGTGHLTNITPLIGGLLAGTFIIHWLPRRYIDVIGEVYMRLPALAQGALLGGAVLGIMQAASSDVVPFIYFQF